MNLRVAAAGCALLVLLPASACVTVRSGTPPTGPGGGPVDVRPSVEPVPGATITLSLSAEGADVGSACTTLDEWVDGTWRARWFWERSSPTAEVIPDGEQRTCPSMGVALPTEQTVTLPEPLDPGTWRVGYLAGEDDVGAYVFEVD